MKLQPRQDNLNRVLGNGEKRLATVPNYLVLNTGMMMTDSRELHTKNP